MYDVIVLHRTSQLVMPQKCIHPHSKTCNVTTKISFMTSVIQQNFFCRNTKFKLVTARRSSSCHMNVYIHISSHAMRRQKNFNNYICSTTIQQIFFTVIRNSDLVSARCSSSCCKNVHIHVSSHVL
jgi:hypothetical protein